MFTQTSIENWIPLPHLRSTSSGDPQTTEPKWSTRFCPKAVLEFDASEFASPDIQIWIPGFRFRIYKASQMKPHRGIFGSFDKAVSCWLFQAVDVEDSERVEEQIIDYEEGERIVLLYLHQSHPK